MTKAPSFALQLSSANSITNSIKMNGTHGLRFKHVTLNTHETVRTCGLTSHLLASNVIAGNGSPFRNTELK